MRKLACRTAAVLRQSRLIGTGWNQLAISGTEGFDDSRVDVLPAVVPPAVKCQDISRGTEGLNRVGCQRDLDVNAGAMGQERDLDAVEVDLSVFKLGAYGQ